MCFLFNSPSHSLAKKHACFNILSLYDSVIFIYKVYLHHILLLWKKATKLVVLNFWRCEYIGILHEFEGGIEKLVLRITFGIQSLHKKWIFYSILTVFFLISFQKSLNSLRCNMIWWCHFNIKWRNLMTMCISSNTTNVQTSYDSLGKILWVR